MVEDAGGNSMVDDKSVAEGNGSLGRSDNKLDEISCSEAFDAESL